MLAAETAGVGTWALAVIDNQLHSSPRCREIFGYAADAKFQYDDFLRSLHPEDRAIVDAVIKRALDPAGTRTYDYEYRIVRGQGEVRWILAKGKTFFEERDGQTVAVRFVGTVLDRTEQKLAQDALIEAERLAIVGRLTASIAHEIRNPIESVVNLLYLIDGEQATERRSKYLQLARQELSCISEIANSTLRFYQDPVGSADFDLSHIIRSMLQLLHGRIAVLQVSVEADVPSETFVSGPQGALRQVLVNLTTNALDACRQNGRLIFRVHRTYDHAAQRPAVRLTIADTGQGMSPEVLKRIFEPFYTTKGASGTGLGLWLSREIIRKCGARIRVKSKLEKGTVFHLYLPAAADVGIEASPEQAPAMDRTSSRSNFPDV